MSIPVFCKCGYIVGVAPAMMGFSLGVSDWPGVCPGKGKHPKPKLRTVKQFFGWLEDIHSYGEMGESAHTRYVGPPSRWALGIAMAIKGGLSIPDRHGRHDSILVNGKWAWKGLGEGWSEVVSDDYRNSLKDKS